MQLDVVTLFPEWFDWFVGQRHVRNAREGGTELRFLNYRETTPLGAGQVDDAPYGGGAGMVLRVDVVDAALHGAYGDSLAGRRIILLSPSGRVFDEELARELAAMVVADAVIRKLPGALGDAESAVEESFSEALGGAPEYPHYTRPPTYRGWEVPEVLLSGDHERVQQWRLDRSRERARG